MGDRFSIEPDDARSPSLVKTEIEITEVVEGHFPEYYLSDYLRCGSWEVGNICQFRDSRLVVEEDMENLEWLE